LPLVSAHCSKGSIAFLSCFPSSVKEYWTLGGISANDSFSTSPSLQSPARVSASDLGLIPFNSLINSLYLRIWWFPSALITRRVHFLLIVSNVPSTKHRQLQPLSSTVVAITLYTRWFKCYKKYTERAFDMCKDRCLHPERMRRTPRECSPEQIQECHPGLKEHPCEHESE